MMEKQFSGFETSTRSLTAIPNNFFRDVMLQIQDINLLKLCLYILWKADTTGDYGYSFTADDLMLDTLFIGGLEHGKDDTASLLNQLLEQACRGQYLLRPENGSELAGSYFINCEAGRAALALQDQAKASATVTLDQVKPNIFKLYEENIGPLTPIIADALRDAEATYSAEWIKEALAIAVENNVRRWRYIETILDRWQKEGRNGTDRGRDKTDYRSYIND
jgi:DnaD/phage-associated family protein